MKRIWKPVKPPVWQHHFSSCFFDSCSDFYKTTMNLIWIPQEPWILRYEQICSVGLLKTLERKHKLINLHCNVPTVEFG